MAESSRTPVSDADLRWQYRLTDWAERGISLDEALASPELRAALHHGAVRRLNKRARQGARNLGAGIERSHPDHTTR